MTLKKSHYLLIKFLKAYIRMEKVIKFGDTEIQKQIFHQQKGPI